MELIMLGTGNAMVTRCYNTCFVLSSGEEYFLVDAGAGNELSVFERAGKQYVGNIHAEDGAWLLDGRTTKTVG